MSHRPRVRVRTLLVVAAVALILLLPTLLALVSVYFEPAPPGQTFFSVSIHDQHHNLLGTEQASENPEEGAKVADILYRAISDAERAPITPFDPKAGTPLYISTNLDGVHAEYTFYFSVSQHTSFYLDSQGQCFLIDSDAAKAFLSTTYAEMLYNRSEPPSLYTNQNQVILPSAVSWYYQTASDSFRRSSSATVAEELKAYEFTGSLALSFSEEPDACSVRIVANGSMIYEGSIAGIGNITVEEGAHLRVYVDARWDSGDGVFYYGELSYDFDAVIVNRAAFSLDRTALSPGEFLILTCENIQTPSQMTLKSDTAISTDFYRFDGILYCIIPYPDSAEGNTLSFTVTYGASAEQFTVALRPAPAPNSYILSREDTELRKAMSSAAQAYLNTLPNSLPAPTDNTLYFRGNTDAFPLSAYPVAYRFGDLLSPSSGGAQVSAIGNQYRTAYGAPVSAVLAGEVLATGYCDTLGHYIVVNHGLGLYTWYAHLSANNVRVGDIVAKGQSIGKAGTGGINDGPGFLLACTVGGRWCHPDAALYHSER